MPSPDPRNLKAFEDFLADAVHTAKDEELLDLVSLFEDDDDLHEAMWSLLHTVESVREEVYVRGVLSRLPRLAENAPGWAELIVLRMLNSDTCRAQVGQATLDAGASLELERVARRIAAGGGRVGEYASEVLEARARRRRVCE